MAEVHIVDIDGEQWDIKDLPLTQRVANLEQTEDITSSVDVLIGSASVVRNGNVIQVSGNIPSGYSGNVDVINNLPKATVSNRLHYGVIVYWNGVVSYARYENQKIVVSANTSNGGTYTVTYIAE